MDLSKTDSLREVLHQFLKEPELGANTIQTLTKLLSEKGIVLNTKTNDDVNIL